MRTKAADAVPTSDALEALRASGDHPLVTSFPYGAVFCFDEDLRYLAAGGLGLSEVGLSREQLEGRTIFEAFPPETATAIEPLYRAALRGEATEMDVPYNGHVYVQRLSAVRDTDGRIIAGIGFTQDVSDARAAEHELRQSNERVRLTFEHAPIGQALVEIDGRWREVNAAVCTLTEYTADQLKSLTFQDITHPDDLEKDLTLLGQLLAGEIGSYQIEKRYFTATGRTVWVLLAVSLVRNEDGEPQYFIAQIQDITERKRQQEALHDLITMLSHDLRTPATVIDGFASLLADLAEDVSPHETRDYAARIRAASRTMHSLLDNAMLASRSEAGQLQASPALVGLDGFVADLLPNLEQYVSAPTVEVPAGLTAWVDPDHLTQILTNLIVNAGKYGGDLVTIAAVADETGVLLSVADDGPGVEEEFVPHLFDRFTRSSAARTGSKRGSGLGLFIVSDLARLNDGSVGYRRGPGGGAEFVVHLPAAAP